MAKKKASDDSPAKKAKKATPRKRAHSDSEGEFDEIHQKGPDGVELDFEMPPKEAFYRLLDNIEAQLPEEDHVKYDSRAKKLDWDKIRFDNYTSDQCKKLWYYMQDRIRRFRIMSELIPDARTWISQPWTNFYKSKDHNRHPDMPKKPLSMYMLFYSEKREQILKENPSLSMPEVAKICSEQYQKLSDKKKAKYKMRCDEMRRLYEEKLASFYSNFPEMKPVKAEKAKKAKVATGPILQTIQQQQQQQLQHQQQQQQQQQQAMSMLSYSSPQVITIGTGQNQQMINVVPMQDQIYTVVQQPQPQMQPQPAPPPPVRTTAQASQSNQQMYPAAPEKPAKPFDLFFKHQMDAHAGDTDFDRQSHGEECRREWKTMKLKKKAKWIKKAADNYREYEEKVANFVAQNPGYVRPQQKNFLTQEDQRILDKYMGRPEKPPSSAYSLFSKEMLNNVEIKKFPSKERMAQISEKWKLLPQEQKDNYQGEVNRSMGVYRQKYEDWFNNLTDAERKAETERLNSSKSVRKQPAAKTTTATSIQEPKIVNVPSNVSPAGPVFSLPNLTPVQVMQQQPQQVQIMPQHINMQMMPAKDRQTLLDDILKREPVEPARSPRQLFFKEWLSMAKNKKKKESDAKSAWKALDKKDKKKWKERLEPQRQKYIEDYTVFVRGLDKEELEMYTELKQKRDEEEENQNESSDSDSDSSESDDSEESSDSDSDI